MLVTIFSDWNSSAHRNADKKGKKKERKTQKEEKVSLDSTELGIGGWLCGGDAIVQGGKKWKQ